ncbi:MAG TPA: hypothetical protein VK141_00805 [Nitrosomonas sp.]|jgi:hypothetical protein|nr:hypothetical protein [Nitrosomonas sp.]
MNKLSKSLIATLLVGSVVTPVFAEQTHATEYQTFNTVDYDALFESESKTVEVAALSNQEMTETQGSFLNFVVGGGVGFATYAAQQTYYGEPITLQGSFYSAGVGALTGGVGGSLIRAAGGGFAGNLAWRPGMMGLNYGFSQYRSYQGW